MTTPLLLRLASRYRSRAGAIVCYHGVVSPDHPTKDVAHVSPQAFWKGIEVIRGTGELVPLRELVRRHRAGKSTAGLHAVTFDDAYLSLLEVLGPELERQHVPVTAFVVSEAADTPIPFWWDRLSELSTHLSASEWRALEVACGVPEGYRERWWKVSEFWPLRQWIIGAHRGRLPPELDYALCELEMRLGLGAGGQRPMAWTELDRFAAIPTVDLAVHTASHPVLPLLSDQEIVYEIERCHSSLRDRYPGALPFLAFPFGLLDQRTVGIARSAGMVASFSLANATMRSYSAWEELPRFTLDARMDALRIWLRLSGLLERIRPSRTRADRHPAPQRSSRSTPTSDRLL